MKKIIPTFIILITLTIFLLSVYSYIKNPIEDTNNKPYYKDETTLDTSKPSTDIPIFDNTIINKSDDISNSEISTSENSTLEKLINPADYECGYYFKEYEICAGTCPEGICTSEGKSCYCKK